MNAENDEKLKKAFIIKPLLLIVAVILAVLPVFISVSLSPVTSTNAAGAYIIKADDKTCDIEGVVRMTDLYYSDWTDFLSGWVIIPDEIKARMNERGTLVYITDRTNELFKDEIEKAGRSTAGYYSSRVLVRRTDGDSYEVLKLSKIVLIEGVGRLKRSLIHEIGHLVSDTDPKEGGMNGILQSDELKRLYAKYAELLQTFDDTAMLNAANDVNEFFAEAFRIYMTDPKWLEEKTDGLTELIRHAIDVFTGGEAANEQL